MVEVGREIVVKKSSSSAASDARLYEQQLKIADTLLRTQGDNVVQLFKTLLNDPFNGEGDWDSISSKYPEEVAKLHKMILALERKVDKHFAQHTSPDAKQIKICAKVTLILCDKVTEFFQQALQDYAAEVTQATEEDQQSPNESELRRSSAAVGTVEDEDDDEPDYSYERSSSIFPKGVTIEDFDACLRGSQSYLKHFAFALLNLMDKVEREAEAFELPSTISQTLSPDFVGYVEVPSQRVVITAKEDSVKNISVLAQGILNTAASAIEDDRTMQATTQRMSGLGPNTNINEQLSEFLLERKIKINDNGEVLFTLSGIPKDYFSTEILHEFRRSLTALEEVFRSRKEFLIESDENPSDGTLLIKFNGGGVLSTPSTGPRTEVNLSGLKAATIRIDEPEEGSIYLPWKRPTGGKKVLVNAGATFWCNGATANLIGEVCCAADLIYGSTHPLADISIRALGGTTHRDFLKGKFLFSLLGETIQYGNDSSLLLRSPAAPRFRPGASYFTFPGHLSNSPSIIQNSGAILRTAKGFSISLANANGLPPNTPTALTRCEQVLATTAKFLKGRKDNYARVKLLPAAAKDSESCRFAIQLFSPDGREQERYYLLENGSLKQITLDPTIVDQAMNGMLEALKQSDEYASAHDVLVEFTKCRIGITNKFAEGLFGIAQGSDDPARLIDFLVEHLLDPLTLIQKDDVSGEKPFFKVGRSGETAFYTTASYMDE